MLQRINMMRSMFWLLATVMLSVSVAARFEDCESPPAVKHASVEIEDDEDTVHATYTCKSGFELQGPNELICDLDTDVWNTDPPLCVKTEASVSENAVSNEVEENAQAKDRQRKKRPLDVPEERSVAPEMAALLDMSCVQAKVKAPEIRHGYVQNYDRRRSGDKTFLVAFYACNDNFEFEDMEITKLYCSEQKWVGELPTCISLGEEEEDYDEYETVDEGDEDDEDEEVDEEDDDVDANAIAETHVALPPPPPPTHGETDELSNEIVPELAPVATAEASTVEPAAAVTDVGIVIEPTQDPYTPRVVDDNCGPDRGGCEHKCERLLFPGENEVRLKCSCFDGFSLDPYDYATCHDIDECELNNGGCEQICNNLPGSFQCACEQGLQVDPLTSRTCVDINECLLRNGHGPCQDTCHNLRPGYRCTCENLPGTRLSADRHACEDAGECANNNGNCSHICLPGILGQVYCLCPSGFQMSYDSKNCFDINECALPEVAAACVGGCENTHGSYRCVPALNSRDTEEDNDDGEDDDDVVVVRTETQTQTHSCAKGFSYSSEGNRCIDIDECQEGTSGCVHCVNTEGSYECSCPAGYDLAEDGHGCLDINECDIVVEDDTEDGVPYRMCAHRCVNTPGSFACSCENGYHLLDDRRNCAPDTCRDLNNPQLNKTRCAHKCVDLPSGVYECVCPEGYQLDDDLHGCKVAENACTEANGYELCQPGTCLPGEDANSFRCVCPPGYVDEVTSCRDLDECTQNPCSHECRNTPGSYQCACPGGYHFAEGSETQCVDIDECQVQQGVCGALTCVNLPSTFTCLCADSSPPDAGTGLCPYKDPCGGSNCSHMCVADEAGGVRCICPEGMLLAADGINCVYQDYCAGNNNGCEHICKGEDQGACACYEGYILAADGKSCQDIDECQASNGGCHQRCINQPGGFSCACELGYAPLDNAGLQDYCFDVDECSLQTHNCGEGLICENLNGSYTCLCPPGYALGLPPMPSPFAPIALSSLRSFSAFSYAKRSLVSLPAPSLLACLDIDECSMSNGNCSHFCLNYPGGFQCACPPGYTLNGQDKRACVLVDGCLLQNGGCSHACNFSGGQVNCSCPAGYALGADSATCQDVDECAEGGAANCSFICINLLGSYACACEAGFELGADRHTCIDVDECALTRHDCSHECLNVAGGYECLCPSGYELGTNRATCVDVNECATTTHGCSHSCDNLEGSFVCNCPEDEVLDVDARTCRPSNDCSLNNGGCSHICTAQLGCSCPAGLTLAANGKTCEDIDECSVNNGDCSHGCQNTFGGYECLCPLGIKPVDGKRCADACPTGFTSNPKQPGHCVDINECATAGRCQYKCLNTNGSYECICPAGYRLRNNRDCEDIDECAQDNGGCVGGKCINQNGSYECKCPVGWRLGIDQRTCERRTESRDQCTPFVAPQNGEIHCTKYRHKKKLFYNTKCKVWCNKGYQLHGPNHRFCNATGHWDNYESQCLPIVCPPMTAPSNGYVLPPACTSGKTFPGERCRLQCYPGFMPIGRTVAVCTRAQQWSNNGTFTCAPAGLLAPAPTTPVLGTGGILNLPPSRGPQKPHSFGFGATSVGIQRPYIKCPHNATIFLATGEKTAHVVLQKPLTNLDYRYIESTPAWTKNLQAHLPAGNYVIVFRGQDPVSGKRARCQSLISVRYAEPPRVAFCTPSFEVALSPGQAYRSVVWQEPRFETTTGTLKKLYKSRLPGELFNAGLHSVYYEATSEEGLTVRCEFKVLVRAAPQAAPQMPMISLNLPSAPQQVPSPVMHPSLTSAKLLAGHESYIVCPGRAPVKVTQAQTVTLPAGCVLRNVRISPLRQYVQKSLFSPRWTPYSNF